MIGQRAGRIRRLATERCDLLRAGLGSRNEWGEWQPGTVTPIANVRIATAPDGRRRDINFEGTRLEADRHIWSPELFVAAAHDRDGDLVKYADEYWRVIGVERWTKELGLNGFVQASLKRIEGQERIGVQAAFSNGFSSGFAIVNRQRNLLPPEPTTGANPFERNLRRLVAIGAELTVKNSSGIITSQSVIPANSHGPAPRGVFATVYVSNENPMGDPMYRVTEDGDTTTTRTGILRRASVNVNFMRPGSGEAAGRFLQWIDTELGKIEETKLCLSLQRGFTRTRADQTVGDRIEERHVVSFNVDRIETTDQVTGAINLVRFDLTHNDGFREIVEIDGC